MHSCGARCDTAAESRFSEDPFVYTSATHGELDSFGSSRSPKVAKPSTKFATRAASSVEMRVVVNGVRLFFDVDGASLVPDGAVMRERPTLLLLHGGPGLDHSIYKPAFSTLTDIAQVVLPGSSRERP